MVRLAHAHMLASASRTLNTGGQGRPGPT
jgi:hypothetical protein